MKCKVPEISWHNRDPVLSLDIHQYPVSEGLHRLATGGNDSHVVVWHLHYQCADETAEGDDRKVTAVADLTHHLKPVNAVRFSPQEHPILASADDDGNIILWRYQSRGPEFAGSSTLDGNDVSGEHYSIWKTLRGHLQDVYDLCWSPDGGQLVSGAVDNTAIIWNVQKGSCTHVLRNHDSFVQGVTWDPRGRYVATLSCDRHCRIFLSQNGRCICKIHRCKLPAAFDKESTDKVTRLFHDDTLQTFCRRLTFTPDGSLLLVPAGIVEPPGEAPVNVVHVFSRHDLSKPVFCMPTENYAVAIRCCPRRFCLRLPSTVDRTKPLWQQTDTLLKLPYRMVIAVATSRTILLYDTQQKQPFGSISNIHFTRLTDITWSSDGLVLCASSTDGFCSLITFEPQELGEEYRPVAPTQAPTDPTKNSSDLPATPTASANATSRSRPQTPVGSFTTKPRPRTPVISTPSNSRPQTPVISTPSSSRPQDQLSTEPSASEPPRSQPQTPVTPTPSSSQVNTPTAESSPGQTPRSTNRPAGRRVQLITVAK